MAISEMIQVFLSAGVRGDELSCYYVPNII